MAAQGSGSVALSDIKTFNTILHTQLAVLQALLDDPLFGLSEPTIGAELETNIINARGEPQYLNQTLLDKAQDPRLAIELNQYDLEFNLTPVKSRGFPFSTLEKEALALNQKVAALASHSNAELLAIGILPTLKPQHLTVDAISNRQRYEVFAQQLLKRRGEKFHIQIDGENPLSLDTNSIALVGAGASFQLHLKVTPQQFTHVFNAVMLVTPLVLAFSANSPSLLGHLLWDETRIALFKQCIDTRIKIKPWHEPPRVTYGSGWNRTGIIELFEANVGLYEPMMAQFSDEDACAAYAAGRVPQLNELKFHQGSVWSWNRGIYDHHDNGHLRIEIRSLPAGPTMVDTMANAAMLTGLVFGLADKIEHWISRLPFKYAEYNFYRAAQYSIDAELVWPHLTQFGLCEANATTLLYTLIEDAEAGLTRLGVAKEESKRYLSIFIERVEKQLNGARWQRLVLAKYEVKRNRTEALYDMLHDYKMMQPLNIPLAQWDNIRK
ncbi:glutamate--cysteine ligase family protein [Flocculibacter collagenilyticus]|uniref:hypothetical protein n=1 Tax=Flocculibacter collagenilyticus TaxID=2744479 RepID=UPI0018F760A2|nr:hypothetical protein [Flocculibacter collagenilyticus]